MIFGGIFDVDARQERLTEVRRELEDPTVWSDGARAQELGRERARLERIVDGFVRLDQGLREGAEMLELLAAEGDEEVAASVAGDLDALEKELGALEFQRMFAGEADADRKSVV